MLDDVRDQFAGRTGGAFMAAPSPVFLTGEEFLRVTSVGNLGSVTLKVSGFVLGSDNRKKWFSFLHGASSNRAASSTDSRLPDGWLLGLRVVASVGTPAFGQTWCELSIGIGQDNTKEIFQSLGCGFVTANQPIVWPNGEYRRATDGPGNIRSIAGSTPSAGAEISETVPSGARWELLSLRAQLATSAAVANRVHALVLDDGTTTFWESEPTVLQTASQTRRKTWSQGYGAEINGPQAVDTCMLLLGNKLGPGFRIRTNTGSIQAGDQYSQIQYLVRETFDV